MTTENPGARKGRWKPGESGNPGGSTISGRRRALQEKALELGCDPIDVMLDTIREFVAQAEASPTVKRRLQMLERACVVARDTAPYLYARLAAIQLQGDDRRPIRIAHLHAHLALTRGGLDLERFDDHQLEAIQQVMAIAGGAGTNGFNGQADGDDGDDGDDPS